MNAKSSASAGWVPPADKTSETDDERVRNVTPLPAGPGRYYDAQWEAALGSLRPLLRRTRLPFQERRVIGDIVPGLLAEAKAVKADLIVIGSHGKGALKSLLVGSVTQKVVALSPVPVLVVH